MRQGPWKLFLPLKSFARHPHFSPEQPVELLLFNLVTDIGSSRNLAAQHSEIVKRLMVLAEQARADLGDRDRPGANQRRPGYVEEPRPQVLKSP